MIDHIILTVSNVEHSLAFYEAALAPLHIKFFMPYKGENGRPDLWGFGDGKRAFFWLKQGKPDPGAIHWGFMAQNDAKVDEFYNTRRPSPRARRITFRPARGWNTTPATTPQMSSIRTGIRSRLFIRVSGSLCDSDNGFSSYAVTATSLPKNR